MHTPQRDLLRRNLHTIFGEFDETMLRLLEPQLAWVELAGGETLFRQHDPGDALYFVISGRLMARVADADGGPARVIGEIMRGETVGEMTIFTGEPRSATVVALRDSVLVRLSKAVFEQVIAAYPAVATNVTRLIIQRLQTQQGARVAQKRPANICLLPLHSGVYAAGFGRELRRYLQPHGPVALAGGAEVAEALGAAVAQASKDAPDDYRRLSQWLDTLETTHDYLLYIADDTPTEWTRRCLRQADEVLLIADATQAPGRMPIEDLLAQQPLTGPAQRLILLHAPATAHPRGTAAWLAARPAVRSHLHLRPNLPADLARLARVLSGTAIGLVLAGGGAKGFAHIGVLQALEEAGIPIDFVGGTSVGALVAGAIAFAEPAALVRRHMHTGARFNPTKDYNLLPLISLIRGRRIRQMISNCIRDFTGHPDADMTDTWRTLFSVASNYTQAREEVHTRGSLTARLAASTAIPGVFPPAIDGNDLLVDGGTFNNFPADVMSRLGAGRIIGVDLTIDKTYDLGIADVPGPWALLRDRFRPRAQRRYRLPSLTAILLNATLLTSAARRQDVRRHLDLCFNPDLSRFSILNWGAFEAIVERGYQHARAQLAALPPDELAAWRG